MGADTEMLQTVRQQVILLAWLALEDFPLWAGEDVWRVVGWVCARTAG